MKKLKEPRLPCPKCGGMEFQGRREGGETTVLFKCAQCGTLKAIIQP